MENNMNDARLISGSGKSKNKILFLGYDETETSIIRKFDASGWDVFHANSGVESSIQIEKYDKIILFGYRHIIPEKVIESRYGAIVNLHISYLPYNRGAHPNYWAHIEGTPHGVTIHLVDRGIDTGPILVQKRVAFDRGEKTFAETYRRLVEEIEHMFTSRARDIIEGNLKPVVQDEPGTFHLLADLPADFGGWDTEVSKEVTRMTKLHNEEIDEKLKIIDEIEKVRTKNNVNWMDILRLAFKSSPEEAKELVKRINTEDNRISELFKKLGE